MKSEQNVNYLLIGDSFVYTGANGYTVDNLSDGQVAIEVLYDASGTYSAGELANNNDGALAAGDRFRIVQKTANDIISSPVINYSDITEKFWQDFDLATDQQIQQVDYIGYNGTSGSVSLINSNPYYVSLIIQGATKDEFGRQLKKFGIYKSDTTATQYEVADGVVDSLVRQTSRDAEVDMSFDVSHDATAITEIVDADELLKFTKGSNIVAVYSEADGTSAGTCTATADTKLSVPSIYGRSFTFSPSTGDHVVYIGSTIVSVSDAGDAAANGAAIVTAINASAAKAYASGTTTVTIYYDDDFYAAPPVVYEGDGTDTLTVTIATGDSTPTLYNIDTGGTNVATITLDRAWQGETCYVDGDNGNSTSVATKCGTVSATNHGIKIGGLPRRFAAGYWSLDPIRFQTSIQDFGSSTVTESQAAVRGTGTGREIAQLEYELIGNQGIEYRAFPYQEPKTRYASTGTNYDLVSIKVLDSLSHSEGTRADSHYQVTVAIDATSGADNLDTVIGSTDIA